MAPGPDTQGYCSLIEALQAAPAERPFITFWVDEDEQQTVTFGEFRRLARKHSCLLRHHGVSSGDRVVIIMPQSIEAMTAFVGAMMLGAVPAFLAYPNFKIEPAKYQSGLIGVTANLSAKAVMIDKDFPDEMLSYVDHRDGLLVRADAAGDEGYQTSPPANPDSLAFIQHSAGTTGLQKGVALTHRSVLRQIEHLRRALRLDEYNDRIYSWLPLYHDMGLIACFMLPMVCHVPVVMQSPLQWVMRPQSMLQILSDHKCTLAWLPNFAFQFTVRRTPPNQRQEYDLSSVRALINCSEPIRASSIQEFKTAFADAGLRTGAIHSSYAMAENVFAVTQSDLDSPTGPAILWADTQIFRAEHRIASVPPESPGSMCFVSSGRLLPGNEIQIISDRGAALAPGCVGEILIQSDTLFEGYYNRPDLSEQVLVNGWYYTGDLGFMLDSQLYVVGRKKDLLIVGGENLYPQDIEEIVCAHPAIHDGRAVATGIYNSDLGTEEIVVVAEFNRHESFIESEAIEKELRHLIVAAMGVAVKRIILKPPKWIVKSTAGKPARSATRAKLLSEHPELGGEG
jgi:fatty-acyl-CoA synthase